MKVLILCNTVIPEVAIKMNIPTSAKPESWISGLYTDLCNQDDIDILMLVPADNNSINIRFGNTTARSYTRDKVRNRKLQNNQFLELLLHENPDVIHIFGTEMQHTISMIDAANRANMAERVVINIQGLVSYVGKYHYYASLPNFAIFACTLRDFIKNQNIFRQRKLFVKRGCDEVEAIKRVSHVIGRTDWDKACTLQINPSINYHFCNETLRESFYHASWNIDVCEKHSIFVSQSHYPLKGFHYMLEAFAILKRDYPDAHLYTTGKNPLSLTRKEKIKCTYYQLYIAKLIRRYGLEKSVSFLGSLNEEQMKERYVNSHVFVCCSSIENSSNSVCEAMLVGTPVVASDVGGIKTFIQHEREGLLYQHDAPYMLADCIGRVFRNDEQAVRYSNNAHLRALKTHDRQSNINQMLEIYAKIVDNKKS